MKKIKILFILPSLEAGGAERVISFVSQNIDNSRFDSQLLVIGHLAKSVYPTESTNTKFLEKSRVLFGVPGIIRFLFKNKPDVVVSSIGHLNTLMALILPVFPKTKLIIREASVISSFRKFTKQNRFYDFLSKICYPLVDAVICQSEDMASDFKKLYNIPDKKLFIINNPITNQAKVSIENDFINNSRNYITIGRLSQEKGHERIFKILAKLDKDFHYTIVGEGPEKNNIISLMHKLNLADKITLVDHTNDVYTYLKKSDLFLQGSYVEGFPNAVLESCSIGTPVIAFNVPGGTREIIEHNCNGFLVDLEDEYLDYLNMDKTWNRKTIISSVDKKFSEESILSSYESLLSII